jgi:hypothetical protein
MKKFLIPAVGIAVVTIVLIVINEFTELTFIRDYAYIFIVAAMFLGLWLAKISDK